MATGPKVNRGLFIALTLLVVLSLGMARFDTYFRQVNYEEGDAAVNALQIERAKHGHEIYGNYSRFEFHHPGPAFFYVYAGAEWLLHDGLHVSPTPADAHLFGCLVLQALFFSLALVIWAAYVPHRAFLPLAIAAAAVHFSLIPSAFVSDWPPNVLLMPFLAFLAAMVSVACGRFDHLPIAAVTGGFLFHGHVAQPLFVGGLGTLAIVVGARRGMKAHHASLRVWLRSHRRSIWLSGAIVIVFLVPLVIDVLTLGTRSNVATILGRFWYNTDQGNSAYKALLYFVSFATGTIDQEHLFAHGTGDVWRFFGAHWLPIAVWLVIFIVPTAVVWSRRRTRPAIETRFLLTAGGFLGATIVLCVLWGKAQAGAMFNFNGYFYYGIYYFALLIGLALVAPWLDRVTPRAVGITVTLLAAGFLGWRERAADPGPQGLDVRNGADAVLATGNSARPKLLVFEHANWPLVAGLALELERRGVDFYAAPWWSFMFEHGHEVTRLGDRPTDRAEVWWITHPATDGIALTPELSVFTQPAPIKPDGDQMNFAGGANAFRYIVRGISAGNLDCATTELPRATFEFAAPKTDHDVRVTLDAQPIDLADKQVPVDVYFNDERIGRVEFTERAQLAVTVPAAQWNRAPTALLELRFPTAKPQRRLYRPDHTWWAALQIWSIAFGRS